MDKLELILLGKVEGRGEPKYVFVDLNKLFTIKDNEPYINSRKLLVIDEAYLTHSWNNLVIKSHEFKTYNELKTFVEQADSSLYRYEVSSNKLVIIHGDYRIILCNIRIGYTEYYIAYESGEFKVTTLNEVNTSKNRAIGYIYKNNKLLELKTYTSMILNSQKENMAKYKMIYNMPGIDISYSQNNLNINSINYKLPTAVLQELIYTAGSINNDSIMNIGHIDKLIIPSWLDYTSWIYDKNAHINKLEVYGNRKIHFMSINDIGITIDTIEFKSCKNGLDKVSIIFDGEYPDKIQNIIFPENLEAISLIGLENIHLQRLKFPERVLVINGCIQNSTIDILDLINLPSLYLSKSIFKNCTIGKVILGPKSSRLIPKIFTDCNVQSVEYSN